MFALTFVSAALLAAQVSASTIAGRSPLHRLLQVRQTLDPDDIPQPCKVKCASTLSALDGTSCVDTACLCTKQVNEGFQTCLSCLLDLGGNDPSLEAQSQASIANYEDACGEEGFPLASLTISAVPGAPTAGSGSSFSIPAATATGSGSIFFSSTGAGSSSTSLPDAGGGAVTNTGNLPTQTRSVITAPITADPAETSTTTPSSGGDGDNAQGGLASSAGAVIASMSTVAMGGLAGIMVLFGI